MIPRVFNRSFSLTLIVILSLGSIQHKVLAQNNDVHPLVGTWVFNATTSFAQMNPAMVTILEETPELRKQFNDSYIGRTMTFTTQGGFVQQMANNVTLQGVWAIEGKTLVINYPDGRNYKQEIGELGPDQLILVMGNADSVMPQQYFVKQ